MRQRVRSLSKHTHKHTRAAASRHLALSLSSLPCCCLRAAPRRFVPAALSRDLLRVALCYARYVCVRARSPLCLCVRVALSLSLCVSVTLPV